MERDFRSIKAIDVDLRPIHHWTETRVRAHVFICMLAAYLAVAGHDTSGFDLLAIPIPTQRRAFELIGAPIPLTLK